MNFKLTFGVSKTMANSHRLITNQNIVTLHRECDAGDIAEVRFNRKPLDRLKVLHEQCETSLNGALTEAYLFHFTKPGKMLRAQLAIQSARVHSADAADADRWGFAVELIHNASLIHDDICDSDLFRRGRQSVMAKFGQQTALCLGDALIAHAFGLLSRESIPRALIAKLASMVRDCSGGQAQEFDTRGYPDWSRYCEIAGGKTASLLAGAVEGGALFDPAVSENPLLSKCCYQMALAYQMLNDCHNIVSSILSRTPSSDFSKARPNALIVLFRDSLSDEERNEFDVSLRKDSKTDLDTQLKGLWWDRLVISNMPQMLEERICSIMSETQSDYEQLSPAMQQIIAPLMTHTINAVAEQNIALSGQSTHYAKKQHG
tara:strand:+ start:1221 stop:2345 length:1125 start_codon:yes stop_codon:yes gene_type:complete